MPEVSLTVLIIAAAVSLFIGFGAAFLIQNSKITSMRAELDHAQKEEQAYAKAAETASQKCEAFAEDMANAKAELAGKDVDIKNLAAQVYDLKQENASLNNDK